MLAMASVSKGAQKVSEQTESNFWRSSLALMKIAMVVAAASCGGVDVTESSPDASASAASDGSLLERQVEAEPVDAGMPGADRDAARLLSDRAHIRGASAPREN